MEKLVEIIKSNTDLLFGFSEFSLFENRLIDCRAKSRIPKNAKTIISFAFPYKINEAPPENISRYAAVPDYHIVCGEILSGLTDALKIHFPQNEFSYFTDNSPIPEVAAAAAAGLGVRGENGLLITKRYGSFVFLGEIVTDLAVPCEDKTERCSGCGACRRACPVGLDKSQCLSAVTQQKKPLSNEQIEKLKKLGSVWGCDICQEVCPHNKGAEGTQLSLFLEGYRDRYSISEDITGRAYAWRGEQVIKRNAEL